MWNKINRFFLKKYENTDFVLQQKSRVILTIGFLIMLFMLILIITNLARGDNSISVIGPLATGFILNFIAILLLRAGRFSISAHLVLCITLLGAWTTLFFNTNTDSLVVLDTILYIPGLLVLTPLVVSERKSSIFIYGAVNLIIFLFFAYYAKVRFNLSLYALSDYLADVTAAIVFISLISYYIFRIYRRALHLAEEEIEKNLDLNMNLEVKVRERTGELNMANEKLREMDRIKSNFFSNISHEIRTPLTLILTPIESALRGEQEVDRDKGFLKNIERNAVKLLRLVNDLLDISKLEAGRMTMTVAEKDIVGFIRLYVDTVNPVAELRRISLGIASTHDSITLCFDAEKMDKVFMNLFSNALKFTPPGGAISIRIRDEGGRCIIEFEDNGTGIPTDRIGIIFDRFSQVDTGPTRRYGGTGIGLSLAREFIEMHGGSISVESRFIDDHPEDHGTLFRISLPTGSDHFTGLTHVRRAAAGEDREHTFREIRLAEIRDLIEDTDVPAEPPAPVGGSGMTILIVEDNLEMRKFLTTLLERRFIIHCATNGKEGLDKAREIMPSLIITDVMMPVMSGYDLTRKIKEDGALRHIPVIMLTARAEITEEIKEMPYGVDDFLIKPFSSSDLLARIDALISPRGDRQVTR